MSFNPKKNILHRILLKGGVFSPAMLLRIIDFAESNGQNYIHLGSRQDILIEGSLENKDILDRYRDLKIEKVTQRIHQNIMSSYLTVDIMPSVSWLNGSIYLNILDSIKNKSHLKINITDPIQSFVPLFTGHLNFIASSNEDYWYLYIKLPGWKKMQPYPVLIFSWDIGTICRLIEQYCLLFSHVQDIFEKINPLYESRNNRTISDVLEIKFKPFPYYEGFNKLNFNQYWLGLYWRNNNYDIAFLKGMAELCIRCRIGKINITPWKSLIIKPIKDENRLEWEKFLGVRGINVRHSLLEMNWHIPVDDEKALRLKSYIVNCLNQLDISTYGLSFGINCIDDVFFTSIVIIASENRVVTGTSHFEDSYNVLHATNFDPNTLNYVTYAQDVIKADLPQLLIELSKLYFRQLGSHDKVVKSKSYTKLNADGTNYYVFQCPDCLTVIDSRLGCEQLELAPGDSVEELNSQHLCPVCDTSIILFNKVSHPEILNSE